MVNTPQDFLLQAWKRQLDAGLGLLEAIAERSTRIHEAQLEAAAQAHADLEATRKAIAAASDVSEVLKLQAQWAQANAQRSAAYWRSIFQAATATDADAEGSKQALLGMVDNAYKQWLEAAQRFYRPVEKVAA